MLVHECVNTSFSVVRPRSACDSNCEAMPEDSVVEYVRCLFEDVALGPSDESYGKPRQGARLSVDDGYASSSSQEADSSEGNVRLPEDDETKYQADTGIIVCRGPSRTRNERIRASPYGEGFRYDYHVDQDAQQTFGSDHHAVYARVPFAHPEPSPNGTVTSSATTYQTPSPSSSTSPGYISADSPLSNSSSGSPLNTNHLGYRHCSATLGNGLEARLDTSSSVLLSPELSDACDTHLEKAAFSEVDRTSTEDLQLDSPGQNATQLASNIPDLGFNTDLLVSYEQDMGLYGDNLMYELPLELVEEVERVLKRDVHTVGQENQDHLANVSKDQRNSSSPVSVPLMTQQQNDLSLGAAMNMCLLTSDMNLPLDSPKAILPEPIEELDIGTRHVPILPKPAFTTASSPSTSPGPLPPLITPARRGTHLSGGAAVLRPEERTLHDSCTLKELNEAQVKVTYLMAKKNLHKRDSVGKTYLHNAVASGQRAAVYWLVKKYLTNPQKWICIDVQDMYKSTPLHYACMVGNPMVVGYLCEAGASVNMVTEEGATPLYLAAERGYTAVVEKLLKVPDIDVDMSNRMRRTPLHAAVMSHNRVLVNQGDQSKRTQINCKDVIIKLLHHEASICEQDIVGETVIHYAVHTQKFDLLEVFTNYGNSDALAKKNKGGNTALHMACHGMSNGGWSEETQEKFVKHLVSSSAPINIINDSGELPRDLVLPNRVSVLRWLSAAPEPP